VILLMAACKRYATRMTVITVTKRPVPKVRSKIILCFLGSRLRHKVGIGRMKIAISVTILTGADAR